MRQFYQPQPEIDPVAQALGYLQSLEAMRGQRAQTNNANSAARVQRQGPLLQLLGMDQDAMKSAEANRIAREQMGLTERGQDLDQKYRGQQLEETRMGREQQARLAQDEMGLKREELGYQGVRNNLMAGQLSQGWMELFNKDKLARESLGTERDAVTSSLLSGLGRVDPMMLPAIRELLRARMGLELPEAAGPANMLDLNALMAQPQN